ncbi:hypothetical protein [Methanosarcina sp. KYL-1]|uniref:hypothetical protein n=1 Tax=Methanosarcina sp. KYL-1 TaxID=2602068 RepID=UPI002101BB61|nr:hypothetical protein [Methanosarcina sp. KYL-1]
MGGVGTAEDRDAEGRGLLTSQSWTKGFPGVRLKRPPTGEIYFSCYVIDMPL